MGQKMKDVRVEYGLEPGESKLKKELKFAISEERKEE